jgi:FeS assembly SUF system regulator
MLKISKLADYGAAVLVSIHSSPQQASSATAIAMQVHLPVSTISKLLKLFLRAGIVESLRGKHGGYFLARAPAQISIVHIIQAIDGPLGLTECSIAEGLCTHEHYCPMRTGWQHVNRTVLHALEHMTLEQMMSASTIATEHSDINVTSVYPQRERNILSLSLEHSHEYTGKPA